MRCALLASSTEFGRLHGTFAVNMVCSFQPPNLQLCSTHVYSDCCDLEMHTHLVAVFWCHLERLHVEHRPVPEAATSRWFIRALTMRVHVAQGAEFQRSAFITKELKADPGPSAAMPAADQELADFKAKPPMVSVLMSSPPVNSMLAFCFHSPFCSGPRVLLICQLLCVQVPDVSTVTGAHVPEAVNAPAGVDVGVKVGADEVHMSRWCDGITPLVCIVVG